MDRWIKRADVALDAVCAFLVDAWDAASIWVRGHSDDAGSIALIILVMVVVVLALAAGPGR